MLRKSFHSLSVPHSRLALHLGMIGLWLAVALLTGCQRTEAKAKTSSPAEVFVAHPVKQLVTEYEEFTGHTAAPETVEVRARVSGYLDKVLFDDGDPVTVGTPLFQIDPRSYAADLKRTEALVAQSRSRLERLDRQLARAGKLLATKTISQDEYDLINFERAEAVSALGAATASQELAALHVDFTKITAKIDGRIGRRFVDEGNLVRADETLLATIVSLDPLYIYFDIDERTVLRLKRMMKEGRITSDLSDKVPVSVTLADEQAEVLQGHINFIDHHLEPSTGTLRARAVVENPDLQLASGLFVRLQVPIGPPRQAVLVREEALGTDQGQRFVFVVNDKNEVVYRPVKTGWLTGNLRVVEEGLETTDRVIVTGLQRVKAGNKVAPQPLLSETRGKAVATRPTESK